ncbi:MAG TPA: ATP-binding protein [Candidatus Eisenbacteria bacterium]
MSPFRLRHRILLVLCAVLLPFAALTFLVVEQRLRGEAVKGLNSDLASARESFAELRRQWQTELTQSAALVAELPYFKAATAVYDPDAPRPAQMEQIATIEPVARDIMSHLGLDFLALTDSRDNLVLAFRGEKRLQEPEFGDAFRRLGQEVVERGLAGGSLDVDGEIEQVIMIPVTAGGVEFGRLAIGRRLDDELAARVRRMTRTEVAILGTSKPLARCCGSADGPRENDLFELVRHSPQLGLVNGAPVELKLAHERFLTLWTPIDDPTGRTIGAYVLQASLDDALSVVDSVRQTMLLLWLVALLTAILLSFRAARQLTSPIDGLSQAARRLSGGDFAARVAEEGAEELRDLARTFNQMSAGLEESHRQLGEYNLRLTERTAELEESHHHLLQSTQMLEQSNRELREMHAQLIQAGKMAAFGELGAGVAHELSQPLTSLKGFAQLALVRMSDDDPARSHLSRIIQSCDHMTRIVSSLKNFARMSQFDQRPISLNGVIEETTVFLAAQFRKHRVRINMELATDLPEVIGDANQLQQVVTNLMANARDAMDGRPDAAVTLSTGTRFGGRWIVARVRDNGPGVPAELRSKIFRTFFTTKDAGKGTGLGLSISRGIIQDHGGRLGVSSSAAGGAVFHIILPTPAVAAERQKNVAA